MYSSLSPLLLLALLPSTLAAPTPSSNNPPTLTRRQETSAATTTYITHGPMNIYTTSAKRAGCLDKVGHATTDESLCGNYTSTCEYGTFTFGWASTGFAAFTLETEEGKCGLVGHDGDEYAKQLNQGFGQVFECTQDLQFQGPTNYSGYGFEFYGDYTENTPPAIQLRWTSFLATTKPHGDPAQVVDYPMNIVGGAPVNATPGVVAVGLTGYPLGEEYYLIPGYNPLPAVYTDPTP